jgi:hypothetical protein
VAFDFFSAAQAFFFIFFFLDKKETQHQGVKKFAKKPPSKLKSVNSLRSDTTFF